ncbi:DUF2285 domain-containing protein [Novosphingobium sp. 9]|uniref:DUF2285 domain-containing protein n=1 Tax=Novosphingobium sp. 9 TaxID=2025349 RepID=UPI0021B57055|nr:DUF2285 domain-containing protein [Novosphingobium sp. 9]
MASIAREIDNPFQALDAVGFAQEFLRRNPVYRAEYARLPPASRMQGKARSWPGDGAWRFPCDPDVSASDGPALWLARAVPAVVILEPAPPGMDGITAHALFSWPDIQADRILADGRHLVLGDCNVPHRIWLRSLDPARALAVSVPGDAFADRRFAAARHLLRRLKLAPDHGAGAEEARGSGTALSPFQRARLAMLLGILDDIGAADRPRMSLHDIAGRHVYRGMTLGRGAVWKTSSQRRRTQRLIREALGLMHGGYRDLLVG